MQILFYWKNQRLKRTLAFPNSFQPVLQMKSEIDVKLKRSNQFD